MLIACGGGILVGALVGGLTLLRNLLLPVFSSLYAVPIVILYPVFTAWFGVGSESKIAFAGIYAFFPVMLSTAAGIRTIDPQFILAARSMGATLPQQITRVIIPASVPTVFTGLRLGGALTIIGVVVSEMLTSAAGIGYLVTLNRTILDSPRVFAAILMILVLAVAYYMLARAHRAPHGGLAVRRPAAAGLRPRQRGRRSRAGGGVAICRLGRALGEPASQLPRSGVRVGSRQEARPNLRIDRRITRRSSHASAPLADHRRRQLSAAGLAGEPRDALEGGAAHAHEGNLAHPRAVPRAGAGRRHRARHPRHGARRHRHHHRRRDAARELLQPLRHRARRHRPRQSRPGQDALGRDDAGAARGRQAPPQPPGRAARHAVPAPQHRPARQDHAAGTVHHGAAGEERVLPRRRRDGHGLRGRRQRGGARPAAGRRRRDPARRAVGAQRSRGGEALRGQGDQPRARRHHGADRGAPLLRLRGGRAGRHQAARLRLPAGARRHASPSRSRSKRRSRSSISAC